MSINKESNGTWTAQCYMIDWTGNKKHKKKRGFKTKRDALAWEHEIKAKAAPIDLLFKDFVEIYFEDKKNELKERTIETKRHMIRTHLLPYFGERRLNEISASDIIRWQNQIAEKNYTKTYERNLQNQLTAVFTHASFIYNLPVNPCKKVKKMGKPDANRLDFWTKDEYLKFIRQLGGGSKYYVIFETLFWTGMREGELLALTKGDIDIERNVIRINKTYYRRNKVDYITPPKTEQSIRTIDIPQFLVNDLKEYMEKIYGLEDDERLFPMVAEAIQHKLKYEIEKGGLKKIRVHDIRHSHVAYLIHQGVQPLIIKERLGHKDIKITLNTYGHLYPSQQKDLAKMLNEKREEESNDK